MDAHQQFSMAPQTDDQPRTQAPPVAAPKPAASEPAKEPKPARAEDAKPKKPKADKPKGDKPKAPAAAPREPKAAAAEAAKVPDAAKAVPPAPSAGPAPAAQPKASLADEAFRVLSKSKAPMSAREIGQALRGQEKLKAGMAARIHVAIRADRRFEGPKEGRWSIRPPRGSGTSRTNR